MKKSKRTKGKNKFNRSILKKDIYKYDRDIIRKNRKTLAIYYALFYHNRNRKKAMTTITIGDESLQSLFSLRKEIFRVLNNVLKRVAYKKQKVAYFSNIELGGTKGELEKGFNPHIHIQWFYDDFTPIQIVLDYIQEESVIKTILNNPLSNIKFYKNYDLKFADDSRKEVFSYVAKDYYKKNYDLTREINKKELGMKMAYYSSSRKLITNYIIQYIYSNLAKLIPSIWRPMDNDKRYVYILSLIKKGNIQVEDKDTIDNTNVNKYTIVKTKYVYIDIY